MHAQDMDRYPSTKFTFLTDAENIARAKRRYFIWIFFGTVIFFLVVGCFSYKLFITPSIFQNPQSFISNNTYVVVDQYGNAKLKLNPGPLLAGLKTKSEESRNDYTREESHIHLETIPEIFVKDMLERKYESLLDFLNLDLLLHYENIINKFDRNALKEIFNEYQHRLLLLENPRDFLDFLIRCKSNKFKFYADILKREKFNLELELFGNFFALTEELNHWYNYINRLPSLLSLYEQQKLGKYLEKCTEKNFEKITGETQKQLYYFAYPFKITQKKLQEINEIINIWSTPIKTEYYNCSVILYRKVLILSDINEEIQRLNVSCLKNLYIFASNIIYLDTDLELFGVNLAMVAPEWVFLRNVIINLNGVTGREFPNETASFNKSGMPGNPGGHAGDFIGIGNLHENFLLISANGGKGGKGQNGAKGLDGMHNTRPGPPVNRPACVSKINTYNNSFGQRITHYKVFSSFGCGGSGKDGGIGGSGGKGGVITIISDSVKITRGLNGTTGAPGKGGPGGRGGQNGCFYEVLDVDDEILYPITKVKCFIGNTLPSGSYGKDNYNSQGQIVIPKKENFTVPNTLYQYLRLAGQDHVKNNNPDLISLLKNLNQLDLHSKISVRDILTEYKLVEVLDRIEFYEIFKEKVLKDLQHYPEDDQQVLQFLVAVILGKTMILKQNVDYFFIDSKNYLNLVERNIKATNEETRELQSVSYFKRKVLNKIEEIKLNLNKTKLKLSLILKVNSDEYFSRNISGLKGNVLNTIITTTDVLLALLSPTSDHAKQMKLGNLLKPLERNGYSPPNDTYYMNDSKISTKSPPNNAEIILLNTLENVRNKTSPKEIGRNLSDLKDALCYLKESSTLSNEVENLLETLTDEVEHFAALYKFFDWKELEESFFKLLNTLAVNSNFDLKDSEEVRFLKNRLVDDMINLQCTFAWQTMQPKLHSVKNLSHCSHLFHNRTAITAITNHKDLVQNILCEDTESFCKNHFEAVFDKNTAAGEFYFWSNGEIRDKLKNLFSGAEINLKCDVINPHVFDKNFIQFRTLKLKFETENTSQEHLKEILSLFKIKMIHSGYSYYNWKGETYVFVSEKVSLEYSFRVQDNNDPEVYNSLFKKCQDGDINLSPYTTWTLSLVPIKDPGDFIKLKPFADSVNLSLIGTGTFIS